MNQVPESFPRLNRTFNLLVAGHRTERLGDQPQVPLEKLKAVMSRLAMLGKDQRLSDEVFGEPLYAPGACEMRVITGTAQGVDSAAIGIAGELGVPVRIVAAGSEAAGRAVSFGCPQDVFDAGDDTAYALRDRFALGHADALLAVWDGNAPKGRAGGVVWLMQQALNCGVPVLWIDLSGTLREVDVSKVDASALFRLTQRVFNAQLAHGEQSIFSAALADPLTPTIRQWLNPLNAGEALGERHRYRQGDAASVQAAALERYARERGENPAREKNAGVIDVFFSALFERDAKRLKRFFEPASEQEPAKRFAVAHPLREWSDSRANIAAGRHRSTVWILYVLSSLAVFAAISGALHMGVEHEGFGAILWPIVEGAVLLSVMLVFRHARKRQFHARWLGHRVISEQLRCLAMTRPLLALGDFCYLPLFHYDSKTQRHTMVSAEAWLVRRSIATDGLSAREQGYDYHQAEHKATAQELLAEIEDQGDYHERNSDRLHHRRHAMHALSGYLVWASFLGVLLHFVLPALGAHEIEWLLYLTAVSPALAAALHGIQTKLELSRVAAASHLTHARLAVLKTAIDAELSDTAPASWERSLYLREIALKADTIMSTENQQWKELIGEQETEMPA